MSKPEMTAEQEAEFISLFTSLSEEQQVEYLALLKSLAEGEVDIAQLLKQS